MIELGAFAAGRVLAGSLAASGLRIVSGGTDTHLVLADLQPTGLTGQEAERRLEAVGIVCNKNSIPFDPRPPLVTTGLRFGTAALTSAGMPPTAFGTVADLIVGGLRAELGSAAADRIAAQARDLAAQYPGYPQEDRGACPVPAGAGTKRS